MKSHSISNLKWYNSDFITRFFLNFKKLQSQNFNGTGIKSKD